MVGHVYKDLGLVILISGFHDEPRDRLNDGTSFFVNDGVSVGIGILFFYTLHLLEFWRNITLFYLLVDFHDLLMSHVFEARWLLPLWFIFSFDQERIFPWLWDMATLSSINGSL